MMCYKDTTFCSRPCATTSCHRNINGVYYNGGPKETWMPIAYAEFNPCTQYQPKEKQNDL